MYTDPCTIALRFDKLMWDEIQDMPGEIFDVPDNIQNMPNSLTFEQIDALLGLIEFHDDWDEVSEIVGTDVTLLHDILSEMRDAVPV